MLLPGVWHFLQCAFANAGVPTTLASLWLSSFRHADFPGPTDHLVTHICAAHSKCQHLLGPFNWQSKHGHCTVVKSPEKV